MNDQLQKEITKAIQYRNQAYKIGMIGNYLAIAVAAVPVIAGILGFVALAGVAAAIAKVLFVVFLVVLVASFIVRAIRGESVV